jgi:hypothetical protein
MALHRLPAIAAEYLEGGAEEEVSLQANRAAFDRLRFRPRLAEGAQGAGLPYVIAPTGLNGLYWRGADMALARAAAAAGVPFTQSTVSNVRLEEIAAVPGIDHWFQLYLFSQMAMVEQLLARAAGAGVRTLVVTVDANTFGNREWNTRLYAAEARPSFAARLDVLRHPRWLAQVYRHGLPGFPNIAEWLGEGAGDLLQASQWLRRNIAPTVRWEELAQVRRLWSGRMLVKGSAMLPMRGGPWRWAPMAWCWAIMAGASLMARSRAWTCWPKRARLWARRPWCWSKAASGAERICSRRSGWEPMRRWAGGRRFMAWRLLARRARRGRWRSCGRSMSAARSCWAMAMWCNRLSARGSGHGGAG